MPKHRKIGDEQIKKGYVRIKVAEPSVWKQKQVYIYEQYHKVNVDKYKQVVIFLDGNNRNFDINNLYLLDRCFITRLCKLRRKGDTAEVLLQKIKIVETEKSMFDLAEKIGLVNKHGTKGARRLKSKSSEASKKYRESLPLEKRKEINHRNYILYSNKINYLKKNDPIKYNEWLEKKRAYSRNYAKKRRGAEK